LTPADGSAVEHGLFGLGGVRLEPPLGRGGAEVGPARGRSRRAADEPRITCRQLGQPRAEGGVPEVLGHCAHSGLDDLMAPAAAHQVAAHCIQVVHRGLEQDDFDPGSAQALGF